MDKYFKRLYIWGIVVLIVISASFFLLYSNNNRIVSNSVKNNTRLSVNLLNEKIIKWLDNRAQLIQSVGSYIALDNHSEQEILNYLKVLLNNNGEFFSLYYGSKNNNMINASGWQMPKDFDSRERPWYKKALKENQLIFTKAFINASQDEIIVTVAYPVYSKKDGQFMGVLAGDLSISNIISYVENNDVVQNGFFMLIDSENNILAHPDIEYNLKEGIPKFNSKYGEQLNLNNFTNNGIKRINIDNKEGYFTSLSVQNTNWKLAHFTSLEYYTEIFNQLVYSFLFALIISALVFIIFLWLQNKYVVNPLRRFNNNIKEIDLENNISYRMPISNDSDFKFLKQSINNVLNKSQRYFEELHEKRQSIKYLAHHDSLTGLPNRRNFMEELQHELDNNNDGLVMLLDIDNFKDINDTMGHAVGDQILIKISQRLNKFKNGNIFISRFGGDEFLILLKSVNKVPNINYYIDELEEVFDKSFVIEENEMQINYSMGISVYPDDAEDIDQLISNADTAMYKAKHATDSNYVFFDPYMTIQLQEVRAIKDILRNALKNDGFKLEYQPQVNLKNGKIESFEALLRLKDHDISPAKFIPVAEEKGLINEIGRWVTKEAVQQLSIWQKNNKDEKSISINFSPTQLTDNDYLAFLKEIIAQENIKPYLLEVEITESILLENKTESINFLDKLENIGVKIVLDDFGKGYSSFNYLTFIPADKVKLDKTLNDQFLHPNRYDTIESLISLLHSLDLKVVAEGIENHAKIERLKSLKCDYLQGYVFSKPKNIAEIEKIYDKSLETLTKI